MALSVFQFDAESSLRELGSPDSSWPMQWVASARPAGITPQAVGCPAPDYLRTESKLGTLQFSLPDACVDRSCGVI